MLARWGRLLKELEAIRARGDHCLLVGDLNKLVGDGSLGIPGNNPEVTAGGQMVRDLVESGNWVLINSMEEVVQGGPYTRQDPATGRGSCLDLWLCTAGLRPHVSSLKIDSDRKWTVARPVRRKGKLQLMHSDHYCMMLTLQDLPAAGLAGKKEKEVKWNIAKDGGWQKYHDLTEKKSGAMAKIIANDENDIEEVVEKLGKIEKKVKVSSIWEVQHEGEDSNSEC